MDASGLRHQNPTGHRSQSPRLLLVALALPMLAIGGAPSWVVPAFAAVMVAAWLRMTRKPGRQLSVPWAAWIGVAAVVITLLQCMPIPGLRSVVAPGLEALVEQALEGTGVSPGPGLSVVPRDTALELCRLVGLVGLTVFAAQLPWRTTAAAVAAVAGLSATIGLGHDALDPDAVYGIYRPLELASAPGSHSRAPFINPNHQGTMILLGLFSAAAIAVDRGLRRRRRDEILVLACAALVVLLPALVLTVSRGAIVAGLVAGVASAVVVARAVRARPRHEPARATAWPWWLGAAAMLLLLVLVSREGAWQEFEALAHAGSDVSLEIKARIAGEGLGLLPLSPVLGLGRGAFVDVFPPFDTAPTHMTFTRLETTPVTMVVEWGPVFGGAIAIAMVVWWLHAFHRAGAHRDHLGRRVALLGLFAVALQGLVDFGLEMLGVAASACALAGALSSSWRRRWSSASARRWGLVALAGACCLSVWALDGTRSFRFERDRAIASGTADPSNALRARPLDARLHRALARRAAEAGDWEASLQRATIATRLQPGAIDGWLLRSTAELALGDVVGADASMKVALARIHAPLDAELVRYLVRRYPDPDHFGRVAPSEPLPSRFLVTSMRKASPPHAYATARLAATGHPDDAVAQQLLVECALDLRNPALALHHARLWRRAAPGEVRAHLAVARALRAFVPRRDDDARDALEQALASEAARDPQAAGQVEEQLVRTLLAIGDEPALRRAEEILPSLLERPVPDRRVRAARNDLARRVRAARDR